VKRPGERISHVDARAAILEVSNRKIPRSSTLSKVRVLSFLHTLFTRLDGPDPRLVFVRTRASVSGFSWLCANSRQNALTIYVAAVCLSRHEARDILQFWKDRSPLSLLFMHHRLRLFFRRACGICCRQMAAGATTLAACLEGAYTCLSPHLHLLSANGSGRDHARRVLGGRVHVLVAASGALHRCSGSPNKSIVFSSLVAQATTCTHAYASTRTHISHLGVFQVLSYMHTSTRVHAHTHTLVYFTHPD
jgi:hypothetical protein